MTPAQCRAARGLLGMTQEELATAAKVGVATIKNFEGARSVPMERTMRDIVAALEAAGVAFIDENGGGPGVRMAAKGKGKRK